MGLKEDYLKERERQVRKTTSGRVILDGWMEREGYKYSLKEISNLEKEVPLGNEAISILNEYIQKRLHEELMKMWTEK